MVNRFHGYIRVSRDDQLNGYGPEVQERQLRAYIAAILCQPNMAQVSMGEILAEDKGVSAWRIPLFERPAGKRLLATIQPGDHVVFAKLDRSFRNPADALKTIDAWNAKGVNVYFADLGMINTASANGKMIVTMLATVAKWWSDIKSERLREAFAIKRQENEKMNGHRKAGYKLVKRYSLIKHKQVVGWCPDRKQFPLLRYIAWLRDRCLARNSRHTHGGKKQMEILPMQQALRAEQNCKWLPWKVPSWRAIATRVESKGHKCEWWHAEYAYKAWRERFEQEWRERPRPSASVPG